MYRAGSFITLLSLAGSFAPVESFAQPAPPATPPPPPAVRRIAISGTGSFLGVGVAEIDTERAKELKLKEERGVEVRSVEEDSPAGKAGVQVGDVVLEFSGTRVEGSEQFVRLVRETPVGRQVKLLISRNGSTQTLTPTIGSRSSGRYFKEFEDAFRLLEPIDIPRPSVTMRNRTLGAETEALGSQLAEYFGVKEGVLVRSVTRGSAAEKAGLKAGDVITKIGDRRVDSVTDLSSALRSRSTGNVSLTIMRNQKEMTIQVALERPSGSIRRSVRMDVKTL